jgi:hypothetical protein
MTPKENEIRKDYLIRVAIKFLRENAYSMSNVFYDDADCDAICLAEDLEIELELEKI